MSLRDLISWGNTSSPSPARREQERSSFLSLQHEMNRLIDDAFRSFEGRHPALGVQFPVAGPSLEISETEKEIKVTAEVPGMEEKDIELLLEDGVLTLKGEKVSETDGKEKQFSERFYGRFERRIPLYNEIDESKIEARFKNGVLTVVLPKSEKAQSDSKRIAINA